MRHLIDDHDDYKSEMAMAKRQTTFLPLVPKKAKNIYGWIELTVMENREFMLPEREYTRKYTNLEPITTDTLIKYIDLLLFEVEQKFI